MCTPAATFVNDKDLLKRLDDNSIQVWSTSCRKVLAELKSIFLFSNTANNEAVLVIITLYCCSL